MATKTVYCVQAFRGTLKRLEKGAFTQHGAREDALAKADKLKGKEAGCVVFRVQGDPAVDCWSEPEILATYGLVPELAA